MGLREEPTTTIPLNHNNTTSTDKFAIPIGKYTTHPSWEKFLVKDCNQHRSLHVINMQRIRDFGMVNPKWLYLSHTSPLKAQISVWKRGQRSCKIQGRG